MGTIEQKLAYLLGTKAAIKDAIRQKGVTVTEEDPFRSYADKIGLIEGGGQHEVSIGEPDVIFYDYDGSIAYSYTKEEALALTVMPDQPQHDGLTRQGWNRTYEELMDIVNECGFCSVEPLYVTDDGHTRLFIDIPTTGRQKYPLYVTASVAGSVSVDWGDGSEEEAFPDLTVVNTYHFYANPGEYVITVKATSGTITFGTGHSTYSAYDNNAYRGMLKKVYLGSNVTEIKAYSYYNCTSLQLVTGHKDITTIGNNAFNLCIDMALFPIVSTISSLGAYAFQNCIELRAINIPSSITSIPNYVCERCESLKMVYMTDYVASIGTRAFCYCKQLDRVRWSTSITATGAGSFMHSGIKEFIAPERLTTISPSTFWGSALRNVYISRRPSIDIQGGAFRNSSLENFKCEADEGTLNGYAFTGCLITYFDGSSFTISGSSSYYFADTQVYNIGKRSILSSTSTGVNGYHFSESSLKHYKGALSSTYQFANAKDLVSVVWSGGTCSIQQYMFRYCSSLKYIDISAYTEKVVSLSTSSSFEGCPSDYLVIVPDHLVESYKAATNWSNIADHIVGGYQPKVCTGLEITAEDVSASATTTTVHYTAITNGYDPRTGAYSENVVVTGTVTSEEFAANESYDNTVTHTITFTYMGVTATTTITQAAKVPAHYVVDLNNQWRESTSIANPDSATYEGVYESFSNYNVNNGTATMYIDIDGYTEFKLYIRSYAESSYDYVMVGALDKVPTTSSNYANTKGAQNSGTAISNYKLVTFSNIDGAAHRITIIYRKDSSANSGTDRGYVLIPKEQ